VVTELGGKLQIRAGQRVAVLDAPAGVALRFRPAQ
jgi:hypothetical protein